MFDYSGNKDPAWRALRGFTLAQLPPTTRRWLLDEGSLTERLIAASGGHFKVQRLHQQWQIPLPSERRLLGLSSRQVALVREVALHCEEQPWVFARSVIPAASLTGALRRLRQLQNQSLGTLIFRNPGLRRSPFELSLLPAYSAYINPALRQEAPAWARRSRFEIDGKCLLVSEVFLQDFRAWSPSTGSV